LSFREVLNKNSWLVIGVSVAVVVLASLVAWRATTDTGYSKPRIQKMAYWYDLNTEELFEAPLTHELTMETDSGPYEGGPAGVRAHVFSCTSCRDGKFIGWLEKPNPNLKGEPKTDFEMARATLIRRVDDDRWVPQGGAQGLRIIESIDARCSSDEIKSCRPKSREIQ